MPRGVVGKGGWISDLLDVGHGILTMQRSLSLVSVLQCFTYIYIWQSRGPSGVVTAHGQSRFRHIEVRRRKCEKTNELT